MQEIGLRAQNLVIILGLIVNILEGPICSFKKKE